MGEKALHNKTDALFRFAMSKDGMKLGVSRYFPPNGGEGPSVELLRRQVADAGVRLPIDEDAAKQIVEAILQDGEIRRIVLVHGIPPQEPKDANLVALGNLDFPVFPGDQFARKHAPRSAQAGETIDGRILNPKEHFEPKDVAISIGENVEFNPITGYFTSQVWGMARYKDGEISVDPLPRISEDMVEVRGEIYHIDFQGQAVTPARIEQEMQRLGVVIDIDTAELANKIRQAAKTKTPLFNQILVAGSHPVPGHDGWFENLASSRKETGTKDDFGRVNFREKGAYPLVESGQILGQLHPPTLGEGGIDIYGKTIPARRGKDLHIHLGENVFVHDDKKTFESRAKGIMVMERNVLSVSDCLLVTGNVDLNSGNVKVRHGSVKVLGSVQAGFEISAPKHVIVAGSVESAKIYAGGNIEVSGGILMPDGGSLQAEGDVVANYATNANIQAGGDVHISNDVTNSVIQAKGHLFAHKGKGRVQGGSIQCGKGMVINELGSELGVITHAAVIVEYDDDKELRRERNKMKSALEKIDNTLGCESVESILKRVSPQKRPAIVKVLNYRTALAKRYEVLSEQVKQVIRQRQEELAGIKITIYKLLHPGSKIKFGTKTFEVKRETEASTIYYSESEKDIVFK